MVWLVMIQAPGRLVTGTVTSPLLPIFTSLRLTRTAAVAVAAGMRCGRTRPGVRSWTAAKSGQGDGHGGHRAPDQHPGGDAEGEGERGVADRVMPRAPNS